jgi:pimeloyl-ACP methyl ester carboxylesterase
VTVGPAEGFVEANGVRLHWLRWETEGEGSRPPVLLLHATGFLAWLWQPVAEALASWYTVWAIDTRGHGDSQIVESSQLTGEGGDLPPYDWHHFVNDCAGFMDAAGLRGIPVVGHSSGGATAAFLAATRPGYVSRLVLIEPIVRPPAYEGGLQRPNELSEGARKRRPVWESREEMVESYRRKETFSAWSPDLLWLYAEHGTRRLEGGDGVSGPFELKCWPEVEAQVFENSASLDTWEVAAQITAPTLVMVGETTNEYLRTMASGLAQRVPGTRLGTIERAGHLAPMERPEAVAEMVLEWLEAEERK